MKRPGKSMLSRNGGGTISACFGVSGSAEPLRRDRLYLRVKIFHDVHSDAKRGPTGHTFRLWEKAIKNSR